MLIFSIVLCSTVIAQDHRRPCLPRCHCESLEHATTGDHIIAVTTDFQVCMEDGRNCFTDCTTVHASGNSSIDTSLIRDIYCGPEVLFETCVAMKFVDDDDDDECMRFVLMLLQILSDMNLSNRQHNVTRFFALLWCSIQSALL